MCGTSNTLNEPSAAPKYQRKLTQVEAQVLLALRAGALGSTEFTERMGYRCGAALLKFVKKGWVVLTQGQYHLTEAGRAACPSRRDFVRSSGQ